MRVERIRRGVEVRLVLNRSEARDAALNALIEAGVIVTIPRQRAVKVFLGVNSIGQNPNHFFVLSTAFERHARLIAIEHGVVPLNHIDNLPSLPLEATFSVGLDSDGEITGATFQFYEQGVSS